MDKNILKQVIADNKREIPKYEVNPRNFVFEDSANYVFVGIRRAGKSYLLYQRIQHLLNEGVSWDEIIYINFEDERLINMTINDLNMILEIHYEMYEKKPILFFDEIQNIEGWEKFARRLADTKYRIYITGSNAKMLSSDIQSTLGGRFLSINVYPYSFKEYLSVNNITIDKESLSATESKAAILRVFNEYFHFGGFPEGARFAVKRDYLTSVYQKIYLGDIATRNRIDNTFALRIMFKKMAESIKQPISYTRIASIISTTGAKISTNTIINYIEYSKDAWLISPIKNIAGKILEKETNPKYYFTDNGILNLFLVDAETSLLENLVAITLLRKYGRDDAVFFYNKDVEVDFYLPDEATAIQVCYDLYNNIDTFERETKALIKLSNFLDCSKLIIITRDEERTIEIQGKTIEIIPIWKWCLECN
ncbi:MAG: ATP-binding protein [Bacteroidales bacterium]|nr:ATP-binding protein [Bacteroidales bacterium]